MNSPWILEEADGKCCLTAYTGAEEDLRIPEGIQIIRRNAFLKCRTLQSVIFPESLLLIEARAFEYCSRLIEITFLNQGTFVDEYAFNETPYWHKLLAEAARCCAGADQNQCPPRLVLPEGLTHIDVWYYSKSRITSAWLPNSLRTIGMSAFQDCAFLTEVSMSPNTYCHVHQNLSLTDGIFSGCKSLEQITFRGPLKNFTWYNASRPQLLRGFDPEKTFVGCNKLRRMIAWEIPLTDFPDDWKRYGIQGYLQDPDRGRHYLSQVQDSYDRVLASMHTSLIRRTASDHSYALHQYLMERRMITQDNFDLVFSRAAMAGATEVTAALLEYQNRYLKTQDFTEALLRDLETL